MGWVPWQRPGFDLGLQLEKCLNENPSIRGIVLGSHGVFTWGETSYESYINSLEVIEAASHYIEDKVAKNSSVFGDKKSKVYLTKKGKKSSTTCPHFERSLLLGKYDDWPFYR